MDTNIPFGQRSFRTLSKVDFQRLQALELQQAADLRAQGVDTTRLDAKIAQNAARHATGGPVERIDMTQWTRFVDGKAPRVTP